MAAKPQQQQLNIGDDEKNNAPIISRELDSTGSLDSALIPAPVHTVLQESEHYRKEYKRLKQQMVIPQQEQRQIDLRINQQHQQYRNELKHLEQENISFAYLIKRQEIDKDALQKQINNLIGQIQSLKFLSQVPPQPINQPRPQPVNNQSQQLEHAQAFYN